jgi:hypothetical protein
VFLIGSAAAIASAALPFAMPIVSPRVYWRRKLWEISLFADETTPGVLIASLWMPGAQLPFWSAGVGSGGSLHWCSGMGKDPIEDDGAHAIRVAVEGTVGRLQMWGHWEDEEGSRPVPRVEMHYFPSRGPAEVFDLEASRAA